MRSLMTDVYHFDYTIITALKNAKRPKGNQGTKNRKRYKNIICAFDIETTTIKDDNAIMYVWQFQVGDRYTIIGRTWEEFKYLIRRLKTACGGSYLVVYVHNLSFEFSFLKGIYPFKEDEVFCTASRKVLKCEMEGILEFRCSYFQNNTSLAKLAEQWGKTRKESGKRYNYKKVRYPWTRLNRKERKYIQADVVALVEAMENKMAYYGDTLYNIPLTATGYVRREVKGIMRGYNHNQLYATLPDAELTLRLVKAFRGGNCHSNRFYANQIIEDVGSADESSCYPASQVLQPKPMGQWCDYTDPRFMTLENVLDLMRSNNAIIMEVIFFNIGLKDLNKSLWGCPYLSRHKCSIDQGIYDNGRVMWAQTLSTFLTDIDLKIILSEYDFDDIIIKSVSVSKYKPLPSVLTDYTIELFRKKTELKGIEGKEVEYRLAKERINSIYGMSVTNPLKDDIKYTSGDFKKVVIDYEERIAKEHKKAFQSYAWGVWITAQSRYALERGLRLVGTDYVYCDTDSIKYIGEHDFSIINDEIIAQAEKVGAFGIDSKGVKHYMGVFEDEGRYSRFKTMGAKRYAYEYSNGSRGVTISGVNKSIGAVELWNRGGLEAFEDGFIFSLAGGTESVYNDNIDRMIELDGRPFRLTDNVCIKDSTYTLGLTGEYMRIINHPDMWYDILSE